MEGIPNKKYGLILPKKNPPIVAPAPGFLKKSSVFEDSDSEDESPGDWMQKTLQKEKYGGGYRSKQSKAEIEKILKEDSTVYEYDEVYDEIQKQRTDVAAAKQAERVERKPRYIQLMKEAKDKREKENERRVNRQVQKEREAEGDQFADKEVFVTAAYKKKLEEMKAAEEEEKRQDRLEAIGDVTKQGDLSGFYRHLYERVVLDVGDEEAEVAHSGPQKMKKRDKQQSKSRQYRKRKSSKSGDEESDDGSDPEKRLKQEVSQSEDNENVEAVPSTHVTKTDGVDSEQIISQSEKLDASIDADSHSDSESEKSIKKEPKDEEDEDEKEEDETTVPEEPPKPKQSVWIKRTIGEVLEDALKRYYERKAARLLAL